MEKNEKEFLYSLKIVKIFNYLDALNKFKILASIQRSLKNEHKKKID